MFPIGNSVGRGVQHLDTHAWTSKCLSPFPAHSFAMNLEYNGLQVSEVSVQALRSTSSLSDKDLSDCFGLFISSFVATGNNFLLQHTHQ